MRKIECLEGKKRVKPVCKGTATCWLDGTPPPMIFGFYGYENSGNLWKTEIFAKYAFFSLEKRKNLTP